MSDKTKLAKIIEIEGTDRSGKETQSRLLKCYLEEKGYKVLMLSFPNYQSESSLGIKEYLTGSYGDMKSINEFQVSSLFAYDRLITYLRDIQYALENNDFIIFDRYVGSNLIHQAGKMIYENKSVDDIHSYLIYWYDYEYNRLTLPKPDLTILLDMPIAAGIQIAKDRKNKINNSSKQDIYESDFSYMECAYAAAKMVSAYFMWSNVECTHKTLFHKNKVKSIRNIHSDVVNLVKEFL